MTNDAGIRWARIRLVWAYIGPILRFRLYADQFLIDHPDYDQCQAKADAVAAVAEFCDALAQA